MTDAFRRSWMIPGFMKQNFMVNYREEKSSYKSDRRFAKYTFFKALHYTLAGILVGWFLVWSFAILDLRHWSLLEILRLGIDLPLVVIYGFPLFPYSVLWLIFANIVSGILILLFDQRSTKTVMLIVWSKSLLLAPIVFALLLVGAIPMITFIHLLFDAIYHLRFIV